MAQLKVRQTYLQIHRFRIRTRKMIEEGTIRKMKNLLTTSSKLPPWTSLVSVYDEKQVSELKVYR